MKRVKNKSKRILAELLWGESGFSVMVVIFAMLVLTVIGYVPVNAQSSSAFYVAEGGLNYAGKYLSDLVSWSSLSDESKNLGNGNFNVAFSDYCAYGSCPEGGSNSRRRQQHVYHRHLHRHLQRWYAGARLEILP
jgi:hypothetical protein